MILAPFWRSLFIEEKRISCWNLCLLLTRARFQYIVGDNVLGERIIDIQRPYFILTVIRTRNQHLAGTWSRLPYGRLISPCWVTLGRMLMQLVLPRRRRWRLKHAKYFRQRFFDAFKRYRARQQLTLSYGYASCDSFLLNRSTRKLRACMHSFLSAEYVFHVFQLGIDAWSECAFSIRIYFNPASRQQLAQLTTSRFASWQHDTVEKLPSKAFSCLFFGSKEVWRLISLWIPATTCATSNFLPNTVNSRWCVCVY